jgi:hypothetical protein
MASRVTRARAAATKIETKETVPKKLGTTKVTKSAPAKKTKVVTEEPATEIIEEPKKSKTRTKATTKSTTLAAAPRRRLKVTLLDTPSAAEEPPPEETKAKKTTTRTKKVATNNAEMEDATPAELTKPIKTRARTTKATEEKIEEKPKPATQTRGRPKRAAAVQAEEAIEQITDIAMLPPRSTRARSTSNAEPPADSITVAPKSKTGVRKKVTFQELPEDDKENLPAPTKRSAAKKEPTAATGIRAKPVRKPAAASTTKKSTAAKSKVPKAAARVLTPKKPTQINKQTTPESDGEDELSGAKTPVRDLSLSPKRNLQLGSRWSPVKKLNFTPKLTSPGRVLEPTTLLSPARRPASTNDGAVPLSPLKESPHRLEVAPVFPSTVEQSVNVAVALSQSVLQQSPKRVQLDPSAFSQSAMKPKSSPFKESLLRSPARRLFSPAKSKTPATSEKYISAGTPEDITISSHFRASVSPQRSGRVHRMSDEELAEELKDAIDFDQSILNVRSPLKIDSSAPNIVNGANTPMVEDDVAPAIQEAMEPLESNIMQEPTVPTVDTMQLREPSTDLDTSGNEVDEVEDGNEDANDDNSTIIVQTDRPKMAGPRLSEILFRSARMGSEDSTSEDELAGNMTPDRAPRLFRSSLTGATTRTRLSTVAPSTLSRDVGYTPLAAQMSGWLASSPDKRGKKKGDASPFSPVAAQHIDGEVQIGRQSTPKQHKSPLAQMTSARSARSRKSAAFPTPDKTSFFEDQMVAHDADIQMEDSIHESTLLEEAMPNNVEAMEVEQSIVAEPVDSESATPPDDTVVIGEGNGELTTDLINFTNASQTAMVDCANLAQEAEQMATPKPEPQQASAETSVCGDENIAPEEAAIAMPSSAIASPIEKVQQVAAETQSGQEQEQLPSMQQVRSPSPSELPLPSSAHGRAYSSVEAITPVRPDPSLPRYVNTVVSKVPLRPEGDASPIKVMKKRSRSLSTAGHHNLGSPLKRPQLTPIGKLTARSVTNDGVYFSPDRSIRSAAPSPAHTTPGQMTFTAEDFGDSTLDGIEVAGIEMDFDVGPPSAAPTPATTRSVKTATARSAAPTPTRTPLKAMGSGVLHGAVVYVEVHTTEGADASGVYIDLLTQMGARCVREWRWNPRTSLAGAGEESASPKVGITHVVYKDGGKRTLEKVRDATGEVWCVGVRWVLE